MATTDQIREGEYADVMPDMSDEEFAALKRSIEENGFDETAPIVVTEDGVIVDGHHRFRACRELGIEPETITVDDPDAEQAYRVNLARRNLNDGTKRKVVASYLVDHWEGDRSLEGVADSLGVSTSTVSRAKERAEEMANPPERKWFSTEETRQQVADYLDKNPDASNREVARNVQADVSHPTVGNWRDEWEDPGEDADGGGDPDEASTGTGSSGDVVDEVPGPTTDDGDDEDGDSSQPANGSETDSAGDDASDTGDEESVSGDPADAEDTTDDDALKDALVRIEELKTEKEEIENKLLEAVDSSPDKQLRDAKQHVARGLNRLPNTPVGQHYAGNEPVDEQINEAENRLKDAIGVLEAIANGK